MDFQTSEKFLVSDLFLSDFILEQLFKRVSL